MLTKNTQMNRDQIEMIALDQLVPADHLVRKIDAAIDFFIYLFACSRHVFIGKRSTKY